MKTPQDMSITELVQTIHYFTGLVRQNAITYEKEHQLGTPYLQEYEKRYNQRVQAIAKRYQRRVPKYRTFRWDERHLLKVPVGEPITQEVAKTDS